MLKEFSKKENTLVFPTSRLLALLLVVLLLHTAKLNAQNYLPRSYWTFDNPSSPLKDSMNLYNIDPNYYQSGYAINNNPANIGVGKYMGLDVTSGYIRGGQVPTDSAFTIEFLFKAGYNFNTAKLFYRMDGAFTGRISYPSIQFATTIKNASGNYITDDFQIQLNQIGRKSYGYYMDGNWHHFVFKYNSNTGVKEVWVDGQLPAGFSTTTATGTFNNLSSTNKDLMINTANYYEQIFGDYDEFATYSYGLPANMIYKHYTNFQAHQHYSFSYTSTPPPAPASVTAGIDLTEFPPGHPNVTVSAIDQLKTFPAPRYKTGHTLLPNCNLIDPVYFGSRFQPGVTDAQADANSVVIQTELAKNFNYMLNIGWSGTGFNSWVTLANANPQWKVSLMTLRPQINGGATKIWYQNFASDHYLQNSSGQFLDNNGNVTSNKVWRPTAPVADYVSDGQAANSLLSTALSGLTRNVDLVTENGEVFPFISNTAMAADPVITAAKNASGLDWENFLAKKIKENETQAYRDQFMSLPRLSGAKFTEYRLDGHREYQFRWEQTRFINTPINGQYYSTADFYVRWPSNWRTWLSAWHGWQWMVETRYNELAQGDKLYSPYIAAGWDANPENDVRPAQWLGLLKVLGMTGAEFYYSCYFNEQASYMPPNPPPFDPKGYAWQAVMPSYAQGIASRYEDLLRNGYLMTGDVWNDYIARNYKAFNFLTGDLRKLVVIRKHNSMNKYAITGTIQPNSSMVGNAENESVATIVLDGQTLKFKVRRQGSTYIYDKTVPTAPVFYQLDEWHEKIHPYSWTKDFNLEAELFDNVNTNVTFKTRVPAGTTSGDFTQATTSIGFTTATNVDYNFLPRGLTSQTYYLWVRARSTTGTATGFTVLLDGANSKTFDCIKDTNWVWYRYTTSNQVVSYANLSLVNHLLRITASNTNLEIDKISITTNSSSLYGTAPNPCTSTATITPNGPTSFCQGGSVTLSANSGTAYLWNTGANTQSINVSTSGTYTVTVTQSASGTSVSSPVTVTVNALPTATITPGGPVTFCQGGNVVLTATSNSSYLWTPGNQTTQSITVSSSGSYTVRTTNSSGCTKLSSPTTVTVNSLPIATITPSGPLSFNQGGSVTLTASSGSSYLWSPGNQTTQSIVVTTTGIYSVRVTNSNGCSAISSTVTVTVNGGSQGVAFITAGGPTTFCSGGSVTLTSNTGVSYIWSTGATTQAITATTTGSYIVTVTFTSNVSTSSPVAVTVTNCSCPVPTGLFEAFVTANNASLNWTPVTGVDSLRIRLHDDISGANYITGGFSGTYNGITLSVGPGRSYHWRVAPKCGSNWTSFSQCNYESFSTPVLRESNPSSGMPLAELYRTGDDASDADWDVEATMNIFPNPASTIAMVSYKGAYEGTILLQLMDFTGKILRTDNEVLAEGVNTYRMDLKGLAKGVYMVIITDSGRVSTKKLVVN